MAEAKKSIIEIADPEVLGVSEGGETISSINRKDAASDASIQNIRDRVVLSTTKKSAEELLLNNPEYQNILALHEEIADSQDLSLEETKIMAMDFIDKSFDLYRRRFSIPDRMVRLKVSCKDGNYVLSLTDGFLCLYKESDSKRTPISLVSNPYGHKKMAN